MNYMIWSIMRKMFRFTKLINNFKQEIVILLIAGLGIRLMLSFFGTLQLDFNTFLAWSMRLANIPLREFYKEWSDYLPGYLYVLMIFGKINLLGLIPQTLLYKLPAILSDLGTAIAIYLIVKRVVSKKLALIASGF